MRGTSFDGDNVRASAGAVTAARRSAGLAAGAVLIGSGACGAVSSSRRGDDGTAGGDGSVFCTGVAAAAGSSDGVPGIATVPESTAGASARSPASTVAATPCVPIAVSLAVVNTRYATYVTTNTMSVTITHTKGALRVPGGISSSTLPCTGAIGTRGLRVLSAEGLARGGLARPPRRSGAERPGRASAECAAPATEAAPANARPGN